MKTNAAITLSLVCLCQSGCASLSIPDDKTVERTASALGLNVGSFTVHDRKDEATTTRYLV